jgi:hypothetical protein
MPLIHKHAHTHICDAMLMQERSKEVLRAMTDESGKLQHKLDCANKELGIGLTPRVRISSRCC